PTFVLCYGVSTFAGLYYKQKRPYHTSIVLLMFVAAIVMWIAQGNTWNMQLNKFPTTLMFLSYTSCMLIVFGNPIKWLCRKAHEVRFVKYIIDQYAHHGYVIYLYHITVIRLIHDIYYLLCEKFALQESFVMHPLCSLTVIAITTLLAMIAVGKIIEPINNTATKIASLVWHKTQSIFTPTSH
ncbi:MAG: hypothetical protein J6U43_03730, partial [Bacteroidales bacterium]|nr:hypothetical protein [Bacteroidales bacterium]